MLLPVQGALSIHSTRYKAFDRDYTLSNHRYGRTDGDDYDVHGSFQPASTRTLQILPEGTRNDGVRSFHTRKTLHFLGPSQAQETTNGVNTFIRHRGEIWRVIGEDEWTDAGAFNVYTCQKVLEHV